MAIVNGAPGFTQLTKLNVTEDLLIDGVPVVGVDASVTEGQVLQFDETTNTLVFAGATVDGITGEWTFDQAINTPAASINIGTNITLSDFGEILSVRNNATNINELAVTGEEIESEGILLPDVATSPPSETLALQPIGTDFGPVQTEAIPREFILDPSTFSSSVPSDEFLVLENIQELSQIPDGAQVRNQIWIGTNDLGHKIFDFIFDLTLGVYSFKPPNPQVFRAGQLYFVRTSVIGPGNLQFKGLQVSPSQFVSKSNIKGYPIQRNQAVTRKTAGHSADTYLRLNDEYTDVVGLTGGIVQNFLPTATTDTITAGQFTPGVVATSNPTVVTDGNTNFAQNDIVLILKSNFNNGYFEVESYVNPLLTVRGVGTVATVEDFTERNFINGVDTAVITKVNVSVIRAGVDGAWEVGQSSVTPITFSDVLSGPGGADTQVQFNNSNVLDGSPNFTFDGTNITLGALTVDRLNIGFNSTGDPIDNITEAQIIIDLAGNLRFASRTNSASDLVFYTNPGTAAIERLRINESGQIGAGIINPDASAIFDLFSTSRGFLPPRMAAAQRDNISSPANGLKIYNTTTNQNNTFKDTVWVGEDICTINLITTASSAATFSLTAGVTLQLVFGAVAMGSGSDPVEIDAAGVTTINEAGCYEFSVLVNGETETNATITIWYRVLVDGVQFGRTFQQSFTVKDESITLSEKIRIDLAVGQIVTVEALTNNSNGQLMQIDPSGTNAAWTVPSEAQSLLINKVVFK